MRRSSGHSFIRCLTCDRYINTLEERIAFLEACLPDHAGDHLDSVSQGFHQLPSADTGPSFTTAQARHRSCYESQAGSISGKVDFDEGTSLVRGVAYLSLCASGTTDTTHEPYYVGSSSGAAIARVIQSSIYRGLNTTPSVSAAVARVDQALDNTPPSVQPVSAESGGLISALPNQEQARMLFDFFFERIHPRWPLLDRAIYEKVFEKQYISGTLSITERSILHLIYAITARFLAVTKKPCGVDDEVSVSNMLTQHKLTFSRYTSPLRRNPWSIS